MATMNLTDYARWRGISERTARRHYADGTLPHPAQKVGRLILVDVPDPEPAIFTQRRTVVYACVTSPKEMKKRTTAIRQWADAHGLSIDMDAVDEDGSHQQLLRLLADPTITRIVTDRIGFDRELVAAALAAQGRELITTAAKPNKPAVALPFKPRIAASGTGA